MFKYINLWLLVFLFILIRIFGDGFLSINITFENTGGPNSGQALALRSSANSNFTNANSLVIKTRYMPISPINSIENGVYMEL